MTSWIPADLLDVVLKPNKRRGVWYHRTMATAFGLACVLVCLFAGAAVVTLLHRVLRPSQREEDSVSVALRNLEPKTGRQRFSIRLFEGAVLGAAWSIGGALLALWAGIPQAQETTQANIASAALLISLVATTWWAWRRGSLREGSGAPSNG